MNVEWTRDAGTLTLYKKDVPMTQSHVPDQVEVSNTGQQMTIVWSDGHKSEYTLFGLRKNCPCVECRGGHGQMGSFDKSLFRVEPTREVEVEQIRQVGNHAIRIYWSDGHNSGMYQWETLRRLCPCDECYEMEVRPGTDSSK